MVLVLPLAWPLPECRGGKRGLDEENYEASLGHRGQSCLAVSFQRYKIEKGLRAVWVIVHSRPNNCAGEQQWYICPGGVDTVTTGESRGDMIHKCEERLPSACIGTSNKEPAWPYLSDTI